MILYFLSLIGLILYILIAGFIFTKSSLEDYTLSIHSNDDYATFLEYEGTIINKVLALMWPLILLILISNIFIMILLRCYKYRSRL